MLGVTVLLEPGSSAMWMTTPPYSRSGEMAGWVRGCHRAVALSNPCIEAWFVYHCADVCSSRTASAVVEELKSKWERGAYEKATEIPQWLIDQTDEACLRGATKAVEFCAGCDRVGRGALERYA